MPIEGYLVYEDDWDEERLIPAIKPGRYVKIASDFSSGEEKLIIVHCLPDDSGGEVYGINAADAGKLLYQAKRRKFEVAEVLEERKLGSVGTTKFERSIITEGRRVASLVLKHTSYPNA